MVSFPPVSPARPHTPPSPHPYAPHDLLLPNNIYRIFYCLQMRCIDVYSFRKVCVTGELFTIIMLYVILQKGIFTGILTKLVYMNIKCRIIGYSRLLSDSTSADLHVIFCYCSYTWIVQLIRQIFNSDISFICWFRVIRVLSCVSWILHS